MNDMPRTLISKKKQPIYQNGKQFGYADYVLCLDEWAGCQLEHGHSSGGHDFPMTRIELRELAEQINKILEDN